MFINSFALAIETTIISLGEKEVKEVKTNKKGQAAMEFLMTYGWAIMAAIIVVGVLWFIIGNPANLAGNRFTVSNPFVQKGLSLNDTTVSINILNGQSESVTIEGIAMSSALCTNLVISITVPAGDEQRFDILCDSTTGDRFNSDLTITYTVGSSTFEQQATGSITARVP